MTKSTGKRRGKRQKAVSSERVRGVNADGSLRLSPVAKVHRASKLSRPTITKFHKDPDYVAEVAERVITQPLLKKLEANDSAPAAPRPTEHEIRDYILSVWVAGTVASLPNDDGTQTIYRDPHTFSQGLVMRGLLPAGLGAHKATVKK